MFMYFYTSWSLCILSKLTVDYMYIIHEVNKYNNLRY